MRRLVRHRPTALGAYTMSGAVVVLATFLPWLRSGDTSRSSYELLGLLTRLDFAPDGAASVLVRWWPMVPLLITTAIVLAWWQRWLISLVAALVGVVYAGGVGGMLAWRAGDTPIRLGPGPMVCAVGSVALLVTAVWMVFTHASANAARARRAGPPADRS